MVCGLAYTLIHFYHLVLHLSLCEYNQYIFQLAKNPHPALSTKCLHRVDIPERSQSATSPPALMRSHYMKIYAQSWKCDPLITPSACTACAFYYSNIKSKVHPAATQMIRELFSQQNHRRRQKSQNANIYKNIPCTKKKGKSRWRFRTQMNKIKVNGARGGVWLGLGQNSARRRDALWNGVAHWGNQHAMKTQGDEKERETDGRKRLIVRTDLV